MTNTLQSECCHHLCDALKHKVILHYNSVCTSQRTQRAFVTKSVLWLLFRQHRYTVRAKLLLNLQLVTSRLKSTFLYHLLIEVV